MQSLLYILEKDVLHLELPHISAHDVVERNPLDVFNLLELFDETFRSSAEESSENQRRKDILQRG